MDSLLPIEHRVASLGNHYQKYVYTIRRFKDSLIRALDRSGQLMQVHLWHTSFDPAEEMRIIRALTDNREVNVQHLSCYYGLQYLHMTFRNLDVLSLGISSEKYPHDVYFRFMMQLGCDFRELSALYLGNLLDIYLEAENRPEFFVCSVGTRADQDDIDVAFVADDHADLEKLNHAIQKITQNMLVYATPLHHYLSEHVGEQIYTTTIPEYKKLLDSHIEDVVILSELINAQRIYGSESLFKRFRAEVISRYFFSRKNDSLYHEGFLRGILGEARAMLINTPSQDAISPKDDALRMLKLVLYAKKTIHNVVEVNAWEIINALIVKESRLKYEYERLFTGISFIEVFKFMLQLFIVQEDTFRLEDLSDKQLAQIADQMGYEPIGTVSAWDQLIIDYYRYVKEIRKIGDFLIVDAARHLKFISIFIKKYRLTGISRGQPYEGTLAHDFISLSSFFTGTKYWDDILELFESDKNLVSAFIEGFDRMEEPEQQAMIGSYVDWVKHSLITITRLITIIGKHQRNITGDTLFRKMCQAFLIRMRSIPYTTDRFCRVYSKYPEYIHDFLQLLPEEFFKHVDQILETPVINERLQKIQVQLKELCNIHRWSGQYFHRFFSRVIAGHPEYLRSLTNTSRLSKIASGLLAMVDVSHDPDTKKKILGDYYDLEFLRVGIGSIRGVGLQTTNREFTVFCDNYIKELYDICTEEAESEENHVLLSRDRLAILAAGGHGRRQAYDDDYDLIAMIDDDDPLILAHTTQIIVRMNREILKRGLLPHYRLGEILGGFVNPVSQITGYLSKNEEDNFIDLSQLLGARMIIGNEDMRCVINERIIEPFIFNRKAQYIRRMIDEIYNRQNTISGWVDGTCSLKETRGGLRDIEAIALMLKAELRLNLPVSEDFFTGITPDLPQFSAEFKDLTGALIFLRTVRNLYRLIVSAEDKIQKEYLQGLVNIFRQKRDSGLDSAEAIITHLEETLAISSQACDKLIGFLEDKIRT
jgi:hypothetical protein